MRDSYVNEKVQEMKEKEEELKELKAEVLKEKLQVIKRNLKNFSNFIAITNFLSQLLTEYSMVTAMGFIEDKLFFISEYNGKRTTAVMTEEKILIERETLKEENKIAYEKFPCVEIIDMIKNLDYSLAYKLQSFNVSSYDYVVNSFYEICETYIHD